MTVDQRLSAGWLEATLAEAPNHHDADERSAKKIAAHFGWALNYFQNRGAVTWPQITPELSLEWCWAGTRGHDGNPRRPELSTARNRQWTLRLMFKIAAALGAEVDARTAAGDPIKRTPPKQPPRPLTDEEDARVCAYGDPGVQPSRRSTVVALARAGGSAREIPYVRVRDVDLDAATATFTGPNARTVALDEWSANTIERYLRLYLAEPDELLCVKSVAVPERAAQSVSVQLNRVLAEAGFARRVDVTGRSLRLTAARRAFERDGIEAAARVLGSPSLDNTADAIGYRWRDHDRAEPSGRDRHLAAPGAGDG